MPRKAKENKLIEDVEKVEIDEKVTSSKVKESKKGTSAKNTAVKSSTKATAKKDSLKKVTTKKVSTKKSDSKKGTSSKPTTKSTIGKTATKKEDSTKTTAKKSSTKKTTTKKTSTKKATTSKATSKAKTAKAKKRKISTKNFKSFKLQAYNFKPSTVEYYDLPYKYNKTVVKALAQNPNTLFVYWEISDEDRESFIKQYGENFFYITKPVLIVHNLTDKYSYELDINDFANNWYIHVNDSKCQYVIELGRKPIEYTQQVPTDYIYITSSNVIEAPNDHVLFFDENDEIYFKNIKTNKYTKRVIKPFLKHIYGIYENLNLSEDINSFDFKNPSSQNPSSNVL